MDAKVMEVDKLSDDTFEAHEYKETHWKKDPKHNFKTRIDTCTKCGLERHMLQSEHTPEEGVIVMYWRSKTQHDREHEPLCWGQLNP